MSTQPLDGGMYVAVGTSGTVVVSDSKATLIRIVVPGTYVGTIQFHDSVTAAGTSATSQVIAVGLPATSTPMSLQIGANFKKGLMYQATGTPVLTFVWDK